LIDRHGHVQPYTLTCQPWAAGNYVLVRRGETDNAGPATSSRGSMVTVTPKHRAVHCVAPGGSQRFAGGRQRRPSRSSFPPPSGNCHVATARTTGDNPTLTVSTGGQPGPSHRNWNSDAECDARRGGDHPDSATVVATLPERHRTGSGHDHRDRGGQRNLGLRQAVHGGSTTRSRIRRTATSAGHNPPIRTNGGGNADRRGAGLRATSPPRRRTALVLVGGRGTGQANQDWTVSTPAGSDGEEHPPHDRRPAPATRAYKPS